jgi:threonine dehydrogenase-like Zn-dependent dehydrogenase
VRVVRSCICGSDLHPFHNLPATPDGKTMGHEFVGVVEDVGRDVTTLRSGDFVIAPFAWSDGTCDFCREDLQTSCRHGGFWNANGVDGCQAEAVRVPLADGTLVKVPAGEDPALLPSLLSPRVHRTAAARRPRRIRCSWQSLRPNRRLRRHPGRVPRHGRPRGPEGHDPAVTRAATGQGG